MTFTHALGYLFFLAEGILVSFCYESDEPKDYPMCNSLMTWILVVSGSSITGFMAAG
jgi:hypothetical protein